MIIDTSDVRSNPNEQIAHAAKVIGKSKDRSKVFLAIHTGKKRFKTVAELVSMTKLPRKRVLEETIKLFNNKIVNRKKMNGELAYEKDDFLAQNKRLILRLAGNPKALENFPTKRNPRSPMITLNITIPRKTVNIRQISIDDIDSFSKVRNAQLNSGSPNLPLSEEIVKLGLQKILGEEGKFEDWGGETDDLFSTRLVLGGKRMNVAFGLKGRGTSSKLTPKKMGKQGDQIQRLFKAPADIFLVQYWGQIDESIIDQMKTFATVKSMYEGKIVYYGVIDGQDTRRLLQAYQDCFAQDTS